MSDRYLSKPEIAALFGSSWEAAEEQLAKAGLRPINLGPGRKRGKRWLESAVLDAMRRIHDKAQPKPQARPGLSGGYIGMDRMSVKDLEKLIGKAGFTCPGIIQ